jgi:hypothetical protein
MLWAQKDAHGNRRYKNVAPDWMWILKMAEDRRCMPWEIDDSEPRITWIIRMMRTAAVENELNNG